MGNTQRVVELAAERKSTRRLQVGTEMRGTHTKKDRAAPEILTERTSATSSPARETSPAWLMRKSN
jgi:hypothetical protein